MKGCDLIQYSVTYRKKNGGIQAIVRFKDKDGKWKQKTKQCGKKKSLAKIAADKIIDELKENQQFNSEFDTLTVSQLKDEYLSHVKLHREPATHSTYKQRLANYSFIDNKTITDLEIIDVQKCINEMVTNGFSISTIKISHTVFNSFMKWVGINYNLKLPVLKGVTIPKDKSNSTGTALITKELKDLIIFYKSRQSYSLNYYIAVLLASKAGLRLGEVSGLTWNDIDFNKGNISVNKQWKILKETGEYGFGNLKSTNSFRTIPIAPSILKELELIKSTAPININRRLISTNNTASLNNGLDESLKKNFHITVHDLRHTYATNLIANGLDFKTTAKLLGHDVEQTMKVYSHVTDEMFDNAKKLIDICIK